MYTFQLADAALYSVLHYALLYWALVHCAVAIAAALHPGTAHYVDMWYALPLWMRLVILFGMPWVLPAVHFIKLLRGVRREVHRGQ